MRFKEKKFFYYKLSTLLKSGFPILKSLYSLNSEKNIYEYKKILPFLIKEIEKGAGFTEAIEKFRDYFSSFEVRIINAGEKSGNLPSVFSSLASYYQYREEIIERMKSGLLYPVVLLHLAILIPSLPVLFLKGIVPFFSKILPPFIFIYGVFFSIYFLYKFFQKEEREKLDKFLISIPYFGELVCKISIVNFLNFFILLYRSGINIVNACELACKTVNNSIIEREIEKSISLMKKGMGVSESFSANPYIPEIVKDMFKTGEISGKTDETLQKVKEYIERELNETIERFLKIFPVIVYLLVALYIAFIIISFYSRYINLISV